MIDDDDDSVITVRLRNLERRHNELSKSNGQHIGSELTHRGTISMESMLDQNSLKGTLFYIISNSQAYLRPWQKYAIEYFARIVNLFQPLVPSYLSTGS